MFLTLFFAVSLCIPDKPAKHTGHDNHLLILPVDFDDLPGVLNHDALLGTFGRASSFATSSFGGTPLLDGIAPFMGGVIPPSNTTRCEARVGGALVGRGVCTPWTDCTSQVSEFSADCAAISNTRCCISLPELRNRPRAALVDYLEEAAAGAFSFASVQVLAVDVATGSVRINGGTDMSHTRLPRTAAEYVGGDGGFWKKKKRDLDSMDMMRDLSDVLDDAGVDLSPWADSQGRVHHVLVVTPSADPRGSATADPVTSFIPTAIYLPSWRHGLRYFGLGGELQEGRPAGAFPGAGTAIHEYLHNLGLPDLYDTTHQTGGIGQVGIMGTGMFAGKQSAPLGLVSVMREHLAWLTPRHLVADTGEAVSTFTYTLSPLATAAAGPDRAIKIQIGQRGEDFLYIENRQATGLDAAIGTNGLCPGVYIYHVNKQDWSRRLYATLTNQASYRQVKLVERSGAYFGDVREDASCDRVAFGYGDVLDMFGVSVSIDAFGAPYTDRQVCVTETSERYSFKTGGTSLGAVTAGQRLAVRWPDFSSRDAMYPLADGSWLPKAFAEPCVSDVTISITMAGREASSGDTDDWLDDVSTAGARVTTTSTGGESSGLELWQIALIVGGAAACCCTAALCFVCAVAGARWRSRKTANRRRLRTGSSLYGLAQARGGSTSSGSAAPASRVSRNSRHSTSHLHSASLNSGAGRSIGRPRVL